MRHFCRTSPGFTILELLILVSIITLLMSLAIPAIVMSKKASQRVVCADKFRRLGTAMYSFNTVENSFPPGISVSLTGPLLTSPELRAHNYMAYLLPYLEGVSLMGPYYFDSNFASPVNQTALSTQLSIMICPSSPPRELLTSNKFVPSLVLTPSVKRNPIVSSLIGPLDAKYTSTFNGALSDYTVIAMVHKDVIRELGLKEEQSWGLGRMGMFPLPVTDTNEILQRISNLVLQPNEDTFQRRFKQGDITDGTGNTIMMVECAGRPQRWEQERRTESQEPVEGGAWGDPETILEINGLPNNPLCLLQCDNYNEIYSFHAGGANFLFADGHVDFIDKLIDSKLLVSLISPNSGDIDNQ